VLNCYSLVNVIDARPPSPHEELLSNDEDDTPEPTGTDAFVGEKPVARNAAR